MLLIFFLGTFILLLGFEMNFGWDWIKLLIIFFIIAVISGSLESAFIRVLIRKSREKNKNKMEVKKVKPR